MNQILLYGCRSVVPKARKIPFLSWIADEFSCRRPLSVLCNSGNELVRQQRSRELRGISPRPLYLVQSRCLTTSRIMCSDTTPLHERAKLVIFDKDGTLIDYGSSWTKMAFETAKRIENETGIIGLADKTLKEWGYDVTSGTWGEGLMNDTPPKVKSRMFEFLSAEGVPDELARSLAENCYDEDHDVATIKGIDDPANLIKGLRDAGYKIAVCTNDSRGSTELILRSLSIDSLVDLVLCGDDDESRDKPDPHNIYYICESLGVQPSEAVMIGDSNRDVGMGKRAGVALNVGVLSGVGANVDLLEADMLMNSIKDVVPLLIPEDKAISRQPSLSPTTKTPRNAPYDYIIIGGGSAGCVLANRLTSNPENKVLILEAGLADQSWKFHMPAALMYTLTNPKYNWCYHTTPQPRMNDRRLYWPRGKVLGGSSSHNAMVYIRGHAFDYDRWEAEGATGWSYADCLPYFRRSETYSEGPDDYRGGDGFLHVTRGQGKNPLFKAFVEAGVQAGYPYTSDVNGFQQEGFGAFDMTIRDGKRSSTSAAFLRPVAYRPNLDAMTSVLAQRLLFDGKRAVGVEVKHKGQLKHLIAEKEVIVSAGAINTPQLLMLSGIGPGDHLKELNIPIHTHLPGVGQNLQDHLEVYMQHKCTQPLSLYKYQWRFPVNMVKTGLEWFTHSTGAAATAHLEAGGFIRSRSGIEHPNIQYHFLPSVVINHGQDMANFHAYQVHAGTLRSNSKGYLKLNSRNPTEDPIIEPNYLSSEQDLLEFRDSVRLTREIFSQKAFDPYRGKEILPGPDVQTDREIDNFIRAQAETAYHPSCTCKMGQSTGDNMAVVDPNCNVYGVEGLRVVDASIMPSIVSGNLNGPVIMMAEKAADIIMGKPPLSKSTALVWKPQSLETQR